MRASALPFPFREAAAHAANWSMFRQQLVTQVDTHIHRRDQRAGLIEMRRITNLDHGFLQVKLSNEIVKIERIPSGCEQ